MIDILCVYWGDKYSSDYVHILKNSIEKNTNIKHRFFCYTNKQIEGVSCIPLVTGYEGWWNKMQLFNNQYYRLENRKIYLDLDIVITGSINWLLEYNGKFMGNQNCGIANRLENRKQYENSFMSAVMSWDAEYAQFIWSFFKENQEQIMKNIKGDGEFLNEFFKQHKINTDLIQNLYPGKFRSFKYECYEAGKLIEGTTLVDFHGEPNPHQAFTETVYPWGIEYEPQTWVADYWRL